MKKKNEVSIKIRRVDKLPISTQQMLLKHGIKDGLVKITITKFFHSSQTITEYKRATKLPSQLFKEFYKLKKEGLK